MKAVIFDMDGLLIDSERIIHEALVYGGDVMNIKDMHETALAMIGRNQRDSRKLCLERYGEDFDYDRLCDLKHEYIFDRIGDGYFPIKPKIDECLGMLRENNIRMAVASSSRRGWVEPSLDFVGIRSYFDHLVCGDMVSKGKPDPEIFLTAAEKLGISPEKCFVLEDSYNGIRAGYASGAKTIMIPDMLPPTDEIAKMTVLVANDPIEAAEFIIKS